MSYMDSIPVSPQNPSGNTASQDSQHYPTNLNTASFSASPSVLHNESPILTAAPRRGSQTHPDEGGVALPDNTSSFGSDEELEVF